MKEQFEQFLKKHRAYRKYFKNVKASQVHITRFNENPLLYISGAFIWSISPEGKEYWSKLSIEWNTILNFNN